MLAVRRIAVQLEIVSKSSTFERLQQQSKLHIKMTWTVKYFFGMNWNILKALMLVLLNPLRN